MNNFNVVVIEGRLVNDPDLRYIQNGTALCSFSVANNYSFYRDNELQKEVNFIEVTAWSKLAEQCGEFLKKGRRVLINGRLKQNRWQDDKGATHSKLGLICSHVRFLDRPEASELSDSDNSSDDDTSV
jgi:single-strand DNA-binding protein